MDRANTTAAVWLGLTVGCAQCHDHKYDPVSQKDYYRLYAFFDSCDEPTMPIGGRPDLEEVIARLNEMEFWLQKNGGSREDIAIIRAEVKRVQGKVPTTLVMRERKAPRETFVQVRGDFLRKGDVVVPSYPTALRSPVVTAAWAPHPPRPRQVADERREPADGPRDGEPRVAEVLRPRLVETENDFGLQGNFPTHPELLDWLAVEFSRERLVLQETPQTDRDRARPTSSPPNV